VHNRIDIDDVIKLKYHVVLVTIFSDGTNKVGTLRSPFTMKRMPLTVIMSDVFDNCIIR